MDSNTLLENQVYPCESTTIAELNEMLQAVYHSNKGDLMRFVSVEAFRNIRWEKVRHLRIVDGILKSRWEEGETRAISRGCYLNADGSWLLFVSPDESWLEDAFSHFGGYLVSLAIINTRMLPRDWSKFPDLRELYIEDNRRLDTFEQIGFLNRLERLTIINCPGIPIISGLGELTQLARLELLACINLTTLSGLEKLAQLTSLNLSHCAHLATLPGIENLTRLTYLSLLGCSRLAPLPSIEKMERLKHLNLSGCRFHTLPEGIQQLKSLRYPTGTRLVGNSD